MERSMLSETSSFRASATQVPLQPIAFCPAVSEDSPQSQMIVGFFLGDIWVYLLNLVGGLEHVIFFHMLGIMIPTDELIFFRGVAQPPTSNIFEAMGPQFWSFFGWTFGSHLLAHHTWGIPVSKRQGTSKQIGNSWLVAQKWHVYGVLILLNQHVQSSWLQLADRQWTNVGALKPEMKDTTRQNHKNGWQTTWICWRWFVLFCPNGKSTFFWGGIYREYDMFYVLGVPKSNINSHSSGLTTFSGGSNYNKKYQFLLERDVPKNSFYHVLPCFTAYYHSMYFVLKLGLNKGITL